MSPNVQWSLSDTGGPTRSGSGSGRTTIGRLVECLHAAIGRERAWVPSIGSRRDNGDG